MNAAPSPIGSTFERYLDEEGIKDQVYEVARERVSRWEDGDGFRCFENDRHLCCRDVTASSPIRAESARKRKIEAGKLGKSLRD